MPRQRNTRQLNGLHRKRPSRLVQSEYRHIKGLTTNGINLRFCYQSEMMAAQLVRRMHVDLIAVLLLGTHATDNLQEQHELMREAVFLLQINQQVLLQIEQSYHQQESILCDLDPLIDVPHEYGPKRNRTIDALSEHQCVAFTRFTKSQLMRIKRCFRLPAIVRIYTAINYSYIFTGEEILLFSLTKMALGLSNQLLGMLIFGGSDSIISCSSIFVHCTIITICRT